MSRVKGAARNVRDVQHFSERIGEAIFVYLRLSNDDIDFVIDDAMPAEHTRFGSSNTGNYTIFNAATDCDSFAFSEKLYDVVTDGNQPLKRALAGNESTTKKLAGAPKKKKKKKKKRSMTTVHARRRYISRCASVSGEERISTPRRTTGGIFATVNMKQVVKGKGYQILHLVEMLDAENTATKTFALKDMRKSRLKVGKYCHDCACVVRTHFEGDLCTLCYLDGYHADGHKCGMRSLKHHATLNSQAAEQLWSRMDKFSFITEMPRAHYRYFLFNYCKWRNAYVACKHYTNDTSPLMSGKKMKLHGKK